MLEMWVKEETSATRTSVLEKWTRLQGMPQHQAMLKYMSIIKEWPGYGSTLFDVEVREVLAQQGVKFCLLKSDPDLSLLCCLFSVKRVGSLMTCGSVSALTTCLCINEVNPNLWRPSSTNTSPSLGPRSPAPTRSSWKRGRCSLRLHW